MQLTRISQRSFPRFQIHTLHGCIKQKTQLFVNVIRVRKTFAPCRSLPLEYRRTLFLGWGLKIDGYDARSLYQLHARPEAIVI